MSERELPEGWEQIPLDLLCEKIRGVTYQRDEASANHSKGHLPILRANNITDNGILFEDLVYVPESCIAKKQLLRKDDVLIAMSSGSKKVVGKAAQITQDWNGGFGAFCGVMRPTENVDKRLVGHFFNSAAYRHTISELSAGTNINNLKAEHFTQIDFPLPPLAEQRRIVAKLEVILEKVNACRKRLDRIPIILKRFRQSVFAAQVSSDDTTLLGDILGSIKYGTATKCHPESKGTPVLRIPNIGDGIVDHSDMKYAVLSAKERTSLNLVPGDILMIRSNGSVALVGKTALVSSNEEGFSYAGYLMRLRINQESALPEFVNLALSTHDVRIQIEVPARSTSGVNNINSEEVRNLSIPFPSLADQKNIVRQVESLFALADRIEERYRIARAQVDKLSQSVLAKAFCGELVLQDPNDEPASALLARIRAERESKPKKKAQRREGKVREET